MATRLETQETTHSLIGSDKVDGTAVYGPDQEKIGSIERVMIDKISGKVAYAVLSFGGFLGIGEDYYPVPWPTLRAAAWPFRIGAQDKENGVSDRRGRGFVLGYGVREAMSCYRRARARRQRGYTEL